MTSLFRRQFKAFCQKNILVFRRSWLTNLLRAVIFPIAYGVFLGYAQFFFSKPSRYGFGTAIPVHRLESVFEGFDGLLVWTDTTDGTGYITGQQIMDQVTSNFTSSQLIAVKHVEDSRQLSDVCITNFIGISACSLALSFDAIPSASPDDTRSLNYTLRVPGYFIDVIGHNSDFERIELPVQMAIDHAIIMLSTGQNTPTLQQLPFTSEDLGNLADSSRRWTYLNLIRTFTGVAFFLSFCGIVYQLAGAVALERSSLLTPHMQAMGAFDSARILSWHVSVSAMYIPAWILLAIIWRSLLFVKTNVGVLIVINVVTGLALASWTFVVCLPFRKSPQTAAVVATGLAILTSAVPITIKKIANPLIATVLSFLFPPMFYVFSLIGVASFEQDDTGASFIHSDPRYKLSLMSMTIAALVSILVWPCLAITLDRYLQGSLRSSRSSSRSHSQEATVPLPQGIVLSVRNLRKVFVTSFFGRKSSEVVAISDLTMHIPAFGIFVLLGPNGAGKSTTLSVLSGLTQATSGEVLFEGNVTQPPRGTLAIVPQKNVLFPELTCLETLHLWEAIKSTETTVNEDLEQLLRDCDLHSEIHSPAGTLSGGQKRKLQLAIGLVSGSKIILVDECTTGVDPLSRRALWKTLTAYRNERTIIFTTHFLDEADFLGDQIAVIDAPGKLIALDSPVALKSSFGEGYSISVTFGSQISTASVALETRIRSIATHVVVTAVDDKRCNYHLQSKDHNVVGQVLRVVENGKSDLDIASYDIAGSTIEDIFLGLIDDSGEDDLNDHVLEPPAAQATIILSDGMQPSTWRQAMTIFHKRTLILRRSWIMPLLAVAVAVIGASWPIRFLDGQAMSCSAERPLESGRLSYPPLFFYRDWVAAAPMSLDAVINSTIPDFYQYAKSDSIRFTDSKESLLETIRAQSGDPTNLGGIYMDFEREDFLVAWTPGHTVDMFNVATNMFYSRALKSATSPLGAKRIATLHAPLPQLQSESLLSLQWLVVFAGAMAIFPAFFALYVAKERQSSVLAMQLSNGLSHPLPLWLGHFLFDSIFTTFASVAIVVVYATTTDKFQGIGLLWLVIWLYGLAATLLSYVASTAMRSPLGAFGVVLVSQFVVYILYVTGYVLILFSPVRLDVPKTMTTIHFVLAVIAPIVSVTRAGLISVNLFSLLCDGRNEALGVDLASMPHYGGPILYLVIWCLALLLVLAQIDTGRPQWWKKSLAKKFIPSFGEKASQHKKKAFHEDVIAENQRATSTTSSDPLRVQHISKDFNGNCAVDDVSFSVSPGSTFVLLGPNGAGKTTTLDIIRGHQVPDAGDVVINETSVMRNKSKARLSLGVCPQFTAIDEHLTVREHLSIYLRLKGIDPKGGDIDRILVAMRLHHYANRLATKLSGGNQRKLALAIALIGNPSVVLIDEYSTGIDAKMKRELWMTLKQVSTNKSILLTTHSMEEAAHLATKVGIMSKRMLAVGTPEELESRNVSYEVQFSCRWRLDHLKAETAMARIPGARKVDDVATRFEVPIVPGSGSAITSVAQLFDFLINERDLPEFAIGRSSLETAFIRIINEDREEESGGLVSRLSV